MTYDELHAEADRIFGPCQIDGCPGSQSSGRHLAVVPDSEPES